MVQKRPAWHYWCRNRTERLPYLFVKSGTFFRLDVNCFDIEFSGCLLTRLRNRLQRISGAGEGVFSRLLFGLPASLRPLRSSESREHDRSSHEVGSG